MRKDAFQSKRRVMPIFALLLGAVLVFGLLGCAKEATSVASRVDVPSYSDPVLDLMARSADLRAKGDVRGQSRIEDVVVFSFFSKYADSIITQKMYRFDDICADTTVNAKMAELIRCRIAFLRLNKEYCTDYSVAVTGYSRTQNSDATVTIGVSATERYYLQGRQTALDQSEWKFVLGKDGEKNIILSVELLSRPADYIYDNFDEGLSATGLPLETPEQIHAAGDEVIRQLYVNRVLPRKKGQQLGNYLTVPLLYTEDYVLTYTPPPYTFEYGKMLVGLADKNGTVIFDDVYQGIGVTENGYFVLQKQNHFYVMNSKGEQIAEYDNLSCHTVYENGVDAYYGAEDFYNRPVAPYAARNTAADGTEEHWLLGKDFQTLGTSYNSLILSDDGAVATKDGSFYSLDKEGNVTEKKEAGVFKTFFGKYQLMIWYDSWYNGDESYGLTDLNGNILYEQKYCKIEMPFEDRVVLYTGNNQSYDERAAALADAKGNIINTQYNLITYLVTKDGYIGIARSFWPNSSVEVGSKEGGCWLVDKDGKPVSEKYQQIGNFLNEEDGWIYVHVEDTASPLMMQSEDGTIKTVPLAEVLIKFY